ncbi:MAG: DUF5710 domain-containing protein [Prochloraceae cyanobacterium]|nr:DUF5710 domain-containing protein [Prochloraceae cyanobacterium]
MSKIYLNVPYSQKDFAYKLGAKWDPEYRKWYVTSGTDLTPFRPWYPPISTPRLTIELVPSTEENYFYRGNPFCFKLCHFANKLSIIRVPSIKMNYSVHVGGQMFVLIYLNLIGIDFANIPIKKLVIAAKYVVGYNDSIFIREVLYDNLLVLVINLTTIEDERCIYF